MAKRRACRGKVGYIALVGTEALYHGGKIAVFRTRGDALVTAGAVSGSSAKRFGARRVCVSRTVRFQ